MSRPYYQEIAEIASDSEVHQPAHPGNCTGTPVVPLESRWRHAS